MASFQYISDLHLEFREETVHVPPLAPYLLLAGDVGDPGLPLYRDFLREVSGLFKDVFLITGNHEYYGKRAMKETDALVETICRECDVHFLNNQSFYFNETTLALWGGTLWTDIPESAAPVVSLCINDFHRIPGFTPKLATQLHKDALCALERDMDASPVGTQWVIMSHHLPQTCLIDPTYQHERIVNTAFASDVVVAGDPRILHWVYGHTHTPNAHGIFKCNPLGYPGENPFRQCTF